MIFKQFFEKETCTFTYILADLESKEAIIIDSVTSAFDLIISNNNSETEQGACGTIEAFNLF